MAQNPPDFEIRPLNLIAEGISSRSASVVAPIHDASWTEYTHICVIVNRQPRVGHVRSYRPPFKRRACKRNILAWLVFADSIKEKFSVSREAAAILEEILDGPLFLESELPPVSTEAYEAPITIRKQTGKQKEFAFESEDN